MKKQRKFTAVIQKGEDGWFVGRIPEVPGVFSQGKSVAETQENLKDALNLFLKTDSTDER